MQSYPINYNDPLESLIIAKNSIEKAHNSINAEIQKSNHLHNNVAELTNKINMTLNQVQNLKEENLRLNDDKNRAINELGIITNQAKDLHNGKNELENRIHLMTQDNNVLNEKMLLMTNRVNELENQHLNLIQSHPNIAATPITPIDPNMQVQPNMNNLNQDQNLIMDLKQKKESLLVNFPYFREGSNIQYESQGNWFNAIVLKHIFSKKDQRMELVIQLPDGKTSVIPYSNLGENVSSFRPI